MGILARSTKSVYLRKVGSRGQKMSEKFDSVAARRAPVTNLTECSIHFERCESTFRDSAESLTDHLGSENLRNKKLQTKLCRYHWIIIGMISLSGIAIFAILGILVNECLTSEADNYVDDYFEKPNDNRFQLNVLPEYEVERYVFPAILPNSVDGIRRDNDNSESPDSTILYRIPSGPKSPRGAGKRASFIQHGILCDTEPRTVNKLQIATVYLLVDQGYDVWLGLSNSSLAENSISHARSTIEALGLRTMNERIERKRLEHVARCILTFTNQTELLVMGYFNGDVQFFAMSVPAVPTEQSELSKWLEYIPGVKIVKKWYYKGKHYLTRGYEKVIESFDLLGRKVDFIIDDPSITNMKNTVLRAWGIMFKMVAPTLSIKDFSKMMNHPDVYLDTVGVERKNTLTRIDCQVETEDGYLLAVHRISGSKKYPTRKGKPVVYLQHGILSSSAVWILTGPSKALAYLLADEGYDVWMGNSRGNTYSRAHVNLSSIENEFWNFSFHEMGYYDLPATIDYIIANTDQKKIHYVGHSEGTTSFFVMLSERPEYNNKINRFIAYAPIVYASNVRSPIVDVFSKISTPIYRALQFLNIHDFLPTNALLTKIGREVCEARTLYQVICSNALFMVTGYDSAQINKTMVPIIMGHLPAGSSVKQFLHFGQEFNSKKFRQFDYYQPHKNCAKYGQSEPPEYNISNVKIPVTIFYASNDWLADSRDVEKLGRELTNAEIHKVPMELFNHIDFMFAMDAPVLIYHPTIEYLRRPLTKKTL